MNRCFLLLTVIALSGCAYSTGNLIGDLTTSREQRMYYRSGDPRYRGANWNQVNANLLGAAGAMNQASANMNRAASAQQPRVVVIPSAPVQGQGVQLSPRFYSDQPREYEVVDANGNRHRYRVEPR